MSHAVPRASELARTRFSEALEEIAAVAAAVDAAQVDRVVGAVGAATALHWGGHGRSGLVAKAVAMRFMHLGYRSHVIGETATPGLRASDAVCLLSSSGSGSALRQAESAKKVGATVVAFTASVQTPLAELADVVCVLPARTEVPSVQHAGSLFEQACLLLGDSIAGALQQIRSVPVEDMNTRHATLQ